MHTPESLIAFEDRVTEAFLAKKIHAPIHLSRGNEAQLIDVFQGIKRTDWVFSNWRSHYHALLHGIPEDALFDMVVNGRSMYINSAKHRFMASSIVGGMLPIALGVAKAIKMKGSYDPLYGQVLDEPTYRSGMQWGFSGERVAEENKRGGWEGYQRRISELPRAWVFVGDMTALSGLYYEVVNYAQAHGLPLSTVVEDNGVSTDTPTAAVWGTGRDFTFSRYYRYERQTPHVGVGVHVDF